MKKETKKTMKKNTGPTSWETDDERFPKKYTHCKVCGRYGEMKLAYDQLSYLCIHAGKCLARAFRDNPTLEEESN